MNIPMAYDVVPAESSLPPSSSNGAVNRPAYASSSGETVAVLAESSTLDQPLLLNSLEQQWSSEMAAEGMAHLPLSWYRQTPKQAVWGPYGVINRTISMLINFGQQRKGT